MSKEVWLAALSTLTGSTVQRSDITCCALSHHTVACRCVPCVSQELQLQTNQRFDTGELTQLAKVQAPSTAPIAAPPLAQEKRTDDL